ncbi:MAG TPA: hypothetical protein VFW77_02725 [Candidatus Saccharimonadales bacterium]|nr:hypothetical protein [Candidatus Saccharimonadales bacterium]
MAASPKAAGARLPRHLHINLRHITFLSFIFDLVTFAALALFAVDISFRYTTVWAFLPVLAALVFILALLPRMGNNRLSNWTAERVSGIFAYFISRTGGVVNRVEGLLERINKRFHKAEPLSRKTLLTFLEEQESMADDEAKPELKLALAGLRIAPEKAGHMMINMDKIKTVLAEDPVGPILLSELHETGRKIFPATGEDSEIIGTIKLDRLAELKSGGKAAGALDEHMETVAKDMTAAEIIGRFAESGAELLFVEQDGRVIGGIYLEDLLKELTP